MKERVKGLFMVFLHLSCLVDEASNTCADDPNFNCAHISTAFNICADLSHAKAVCRKFCNLCAAPCADDPTFDCAHINTAFNICADVTHAKTVCRKFCNLCGHDDIRDCKDALDKRATSINGQDIFRINSGTGNKSSLVQCDMVTGGGGWIILMNRESNNTNFYKGAAEYASGFGSLGKDFWIGLNTMHMLTSDGRRYQLRVDMTRANGNHFYAVYDDFSIGPKPDFVLHIGSYHGTAGDSLRHHSGYGFSTFDDDRDSNQLANCASYLQGAWWFYNCYDSCLTCPYSTPGQAQCRSMSWNAIHYCETLHSSRMMLRPM